VRTFVKGSRRRVRLAELADRRLVVLVIVAALVLIYLIWWVSYAQIHQNSRYRDLRPGAAASTKALTVRLERLVIADQLADKNGEPPALPAPGASWVVARLQATARDPAGACCEFPLVAANGATWKSTYPPVTRELGALYSAERAPYEFELVYKVPAGVTQQLVGIAVEDGTSAARTPVLRPAPG
jgi:hypothetical protein